MFSFGKDVEGSIKRKEILKKIYGDNIAIPPIAIETTFKPNPFEGHISFMKLLNSDNVGKVKEYFNTLTKRHNMYDVGKQGISDDDGVGSKRITVFDRNFATLLTTFIEQNLANSDLMTTAKGKNIVGTHTQLPSTVIINENSCVDAPHGAYKFVGVSPMFRYMEYSEGGEHFPHYDAPYVYEEGLQTLFSGVLYLTTCDYGDGGETAFVLDEKNMYKDFKDWDTRDWTRQATDDEIYVSFRPTEGHALLFQHQMCHTVLPFKPYNDNEKRIIIRFDIVYTSLEV